jgi:hypothetical protein
MSSDPVKAKARWPTGCLVVFGAVGMLVVGALGLQGWRWYERRHHAPVADLLPLGSGWWCPIGGGRCERQANDCALPFRGSTAGNQGCAPRDTAHCLTKTVVVVSGASIVCVNSDNPDCERIRFREYDCFSSRNLCDERRDELLDADGTERVSDCAAIH